ncbi:Mannosyl-oligosaccharide alpha-1,2-mannosidase IA [Hypsibius exemplaris]|uniref:alpha-1,2-Mannosidase n=1 Tax=Hypsibius exemplaris TaxID=2072580 RepID=A0A9X6RJW2_HYPEX|nr:Mannosyl-oligosaccharide alpha-1,2-mannosidase IA [Hypsibius exemplaris]
MRTTSEILITVDCCGTAAADNNTVTGDNDDSAHLRVGVVDGELDDGTTTTTSQVSVCQVGEGAMRRDHRSFFPPKRKLLRWLAVVGMCAVGLLLLYSVTAGSRRRHDQIRSDPDFARAVNAPQRRTNIYRKNFVKQMMQHAWINYATYAWGHNELRPNSKSGYGGSNFGEAMLGLTIVDSLDTLYLMGLHKELENATDWIKTKFNIRNAISTMSVFEANIRLLGGFLSIHALTGQKVFIEKAIDVANQLLPAFNSPNGFPWSLIEINSAQGFLYTWLGSDCVFLADVGTLHLEFAYLSEITGHPVYLNKVEKVRDLLKHAKSLEGLYPNLVDINNNNGSKCSHGVSVSVGAFGDSFYEYLSKAWLQSAGTDIEAKEMFYPAMDALEGHLLQTSASGLKYFAKLEESRALSHKMEHLACFIGGLYALSAKDSKNPTHYMQLAKDLTYTCRLSYNSTFTGLGPELFKFNEDGNPTPLVGDSRQYSLRPEVIESYYYLWKTTGDEQYRGWAWDAAQAIEKNCRTENGYTGIADVDAPNAASDNVQQSYFMAETLKYLYLIFLDVDPVPLDTWVFNTEAHPLPVIGSQPFKDAFRAWRGIEFSDQHGLVRQKESGSDRLLVEEKNHLPEYILGNSSVCDQRSPISLFFLLFLLLLIHRFNDDVL